MSIPDYEKLGAFYLGRAVDPESGGDTDELALYDSRDLTCAHRTLPFGTRVKVTNLDNDRSVVVRVNDRGPFKDGRIIDVSKKAADQLGFVNAGLARVKIQGLGN